MSSCLENYKKYPNLTEAYEVVQTVRVVARRRRYQIQVLKCYSSSPVHYTVRYWDIDCAYLQPSYPRSGAPGKEVFERHPEDREILMRNQFLPDVYQSDPEVALHQALNFLTGRE